MTHPIAKARGPATLLAELAIWPSVSAKSPVLHTPMVGACTGGNSKSDRRYDSGGTLAR
jgi:hypothetical protein